MRCARLISLLVGSVAVASAAQAGGYNWSGLYLGAHGGYGWADTDYPGQPAYPSGPPRPNLEGGLVGGQVGYNVQLTNVVLGVEADYSFTQMSDTTRDGNYLTQDHEISGLGSVRGRLGYAFGNFLPYATAGWAWNRASFNQTCPDPNAVPFGHCNLANGYAPYDITKDETETGWVYGGGVETLITSNWSLRAEYLRYDFDDQSYNLGKTPSGKELGSKTLSHDVDVVRFGVNYKFGGREEPVPLK